MSAVAKMQTRFERAMWILAGKYSSFPVIATTIAGWEQELRRFDICVQEQALSLLPSVCRARAPNAGEAVTVAEAIERWGFAATQKAAREWVGGVPREKQDQVYVPSAARFHEAVAVAAKQLPPDRPPAGELPARGESTETPDAEWLAAVRAKMAEGMTEAKAIMELVAERSGIRWQ